ncbi:MAG: hypothetical protein K2K55_03460 [Duncaniella sp.]|nr:hypothetical protein [Duncaniella sp.]
MKTFLPILITPGGVRKHVIVDTEPLAISDFTHETHSTTAFNGVGVLCDADICLPVSVMLTNLGGILPDLLRAARCSKNCVLRLIPFR